MNLGNYFKDKGIGFWFSVATIILLIVSGITFIAVAPNLVEYVTYANKTVKPWFYTFVTCVPLVGAAASIACIGFKQYKVLPYVEFLTALISLLVFGYISYRYVFEYILDIEVHSIYTEVIIMAVLYVGTLITSIVCMFTDHTKKIEEVAHEQE